MNKINTTSINVHCLSRVFNMLFVVIVTAFVLLRSPVCAARDNYVFVLQSLNSSFNSSILDRNFIDGMALQIGWRDVERAQGKYNWQRVDQLVAEAKSRNKRITLHLITLASTGMDIYCGRRALLFYDARAKRVYAGQGVVRNSALGSCLPRTLVTTHRGIW